ncbi:transmembrane hyphal anastomosis protein Ham2/Far11 [Talaromyces proteolyticus]|uniref:Transmembrane hyphal anastomosis protein Ham2/Far11 n=1 Tax=Talaromyces proteolyticus TaxID=1131652 RepID=A0AAD4KMW2_9EURO|nr:transmembrane hyphal anastomosis protein Ham2/Far11 [Talaromyces proteolyticus]KAH8695124.1 transmembrane hyphal anastomosis protein Ham2/Far11 [Talaromyces proteolyticus]
MSTLHYKMSADPIEGDEPSQVIVKADEVDQTGTDISPIPDEQLMAEVVDGLTLEPSPLIEDQVQQVPGSRDPRQTGRPAIRRDGVAPPPPLQPPPPAPGQQATELAPDSLSLAQLKKIVQDMPRFEQQAYAFRYADCQSFPEELDEWFQYSEPERMMLLGSKVSFEQQWQDFCQQSSLHPDPSWLDVGRDLRKSFVNSLLVNLDHEDMFSRIEALEAICYAMCGVWGSTAGRSVDDYPDEPTEQEKAETPKLKSLQIEWIVNNVLLVHECDGIPKLFEYMRVVYDKERSLVDTESIDLDNEKEHAAYLIAREREANLILTCLYFAVEVARRLESLDRQNVDLRNSIASLEPSLLVALIEIVAGLRWDDSASIPFTRIILLFWKSILLIFGGSESLKDAKKRLEPLMNIPEDPADRREPFLTASPLDYHIFRQEVTSKYPSYNPPPPVVPLELEHNSILPPLPNHPSRLASGNGLFSASGSTAPGGSGSIIHQPVHIATPAPSPPPSPVGPGGKAGKKQNYQTNQNFPFMYPPLDVSSNNIGGKGTSEMQDTLVGKKWEGSDVPASIIEAGKLFSTHVKMTRATRQLWEERERFMKFERGWNMEDMSLKSDNQEDNESNNSSKDEKDKDTAKEVETDDEDIQRRLDAVEAFYKQAMPHLQSIVIVLLKVILTNVSAIVNQVNSHNSHSSGAANGYHSSGSAHEEPPTDVEEIDMARLREITGKAVSGALLLLLKWFKRSHIFKFEYMTQLLLDSNYLPLILKMFAHQDVDQAISQQNDRKELSFFNFCLRNSQYAPEEGDSIDGDSSGEDEAVPPPILRRRLSLDGSSSVRGVSPEKPAASEFSDGSLRPEVDELGYPTGLLPKDPITTYSFRNFFSTINYLHIMQKITRDKAHRCLLLVQYKSSTILRKGLKIPDPDLRLYTLKLFKSQVPYCGRKWRQTNMRVITAIYLYCRPELRDDWLAGSDVDAEVEEALPLEQALRGLTHWWHLRQYRDVMNIEEGASLIEEERDFFSRELDAMGWGLYSDDILNDLGDERELGAPTNGTTEWDGGPLQMEGW